MAIWTAHRTAPSGGQGKSGAGRNPSPRCAAAKDWLAQQDETMNWELRIPWSPGAINASVAWASRSLEESQALAKKCGQVVAARRQRLRCADSK